MDISQEGLQTLAAVVREGTFDAAAARLHITPSAVSQRIKALESAVGRILLRRTKPVTPTADGETLVRLAMQWELLIAQTRADLTGDAGDEPGTRIHLPIAANADSLATRVLPVLARMHHEHDVAIEVLRDDESQSLRFLRSGDALAAITSDRTELRGCAIRPLGSMRYLPVATPQFVERWFPDGLTPEALGRAPMVQFDRNDDIQANVLASLVAEPSSPPKTYIPASSEYARAIELGMGWGAVPHVQAADALGSGALVRIVDRHVDVPLYWQYWKLSSPLVDSLTQMTLAAAREYLV